MPRRGNRNKRKTTMSPSLKDPPPILPSAATKTAPKEQAQPSLDPSSLLLTIHSELTNLGKSLTCPLCLHTLSNPSLLPCIHAFCHKCITQHLSTSPQTKQCCPVCKVKCTKRSISQTNGSHLADLVLGYKQALRAFGMVPIVYSETIEMTQIPREQDEKKEKEEGLKACHEHLEVSRTLHRILENAAVHAQQTTALAAKPSSTSFTTTTSRGKTRQTRSAAAAANDNKKMTKSEEMQQKRHLQKLQLLVSEQKKVVQVDERALIQAAVGKTKKKKKEEGRLSAVNEKEEEEGNFVTFENVQDDNDDDVPCGKSSAKTDNSKEEQESNETDQNSRENEEHTAEKQHEKMNEPLPVTTIMMSSQEAYDISADDAREKEAADRSGEWILEEIEEEEKDKDGKRLEQPKEETAENRKKNSSKKKRVTKRGRGRPSVAKDDDDTKNDNHNDSSSPPISKNKKSASELPPSTPNTTTAKTTAPSNNTIKIGTIVQVQARTWPGVNKPGGVARITQIHHSSSSHTTTYDVAYVLGGKEKHVDDAFVSVQKEEEEDSFASPVADQKERRSGRKSARRSPRRSLSPPIQEVASSPKRRKRAEKMEPKKTATTPTTTPKPKGRSTSPASTSRKRPTRRAAAIAAAAVASQTKPARKGKENDVPPEVLAQIAQMEEDSSNIQNKNQKENKAAAAAAAIPKQEKTKARKKRGLSKRSSNQGDGATIDNDSAAPCPKRMKKSTTTAPVSSSSSSSTLQHSSSITITKKSWTDLEKMGMADAWYKQTLFGSAAAPSLEGEGIIPRGTVMNIVTSSLSEYEKDMIRLFCVEMKKCLGVTIKETKDFQPSKTTVCITPAAQNPQNKNSTNPISVTSKYRTLKAMRAALACIPIVTTDWVAACLEQKKIIPPNGDVCIRTLPTKLEHLLSCHETKKGDVSVPTARFGVSNYASIMYQQTLEQKSCAESKEHLPLKNTAVFLSGSQWSKKGPKKIDVQILLKESGASILSSASMTTKALKELQQEKDGASSDDNTRGAIVILCDDSTTDDGCGISGALLKEVKRVIGEQHGSSSVMVVNTIWLFDCVSCGCVLEAKDYGPSIPLAKNLWKLCMRK